MNSVSAPLQPTPAVQVSHSILHNFIGYEYKTEFREKNTITCSNIDTHTHTATAESTAKQERETDPPQVMTTVRGATQGSVKSNSP